ncbi:MAG TPA: TadE/TadG family type IV pilus assembly protein [Candidatus Acidoferrales bacterium]|nr:TadE/TadG family type IV pilus assembly protein [Candidatus Acidoferrales bacterium]
MSAKRKMRSGSANETRYRISPGRAILRRQSGQTLLEVALLTPLLLLLLLGVIEMGRYAYFGILVGNAARAGAAYGAQSLPQSTCSATPCGIQLAAYNDFDPQNGGSQPANLTVTSVTSCGCDSGGTITAAVCSGTLTEGTCATGHWVVMVSVTASGTFSSLFNYPGIPASMTISRTSTMRVAN